MNTNTNEKTGASAVPDENTENQSKNSEKFKLILSQSFKNGMVYIAQLLEAKKENIIQNSDIKLPLSDEFRKLSKTKRLLAFTESIRIIKMICDDLTTEKIKEMFDEMESNQKIINT